MFIVEFIQDILPELIILFLGGVCGILRHQVSVMRKKHEEEQNKALREYQTLQKAVRAMVRVELIREHNKRVADGYCPTYAYESYVDLYIQYKSLGGNGMVTRLKEEMDALPINRMKGDRSV